VQRVLALVGVGVMAVVLSASASRATSTTASVKTDFWGSGVAVVDPTVPANNSTPSAYASIDLKITLRDIYGGTGLTWDNGPNNVIGGCGAPVCLQAVMKPRIYRFPYVAGVGGPVPEAGIGHFTLYWHDANGRIHRARLPVQRDIGFARLPAWATPNHNDKVQSGTWGKGVAVVDPTVPANDSTPSNYAAVYLKITLRNAYGGTGLNWDNGPNNVIAGCGAPVCVPRVMKPGVYRFPYVAGAGSKVAEAGIGHFTLRWHDARGQFHSARLPIQSDIGFAHLPAWAKP
jgi:hypothetical protein